MRKDKNDLDELYQRLDYPANTSVSGSLTYGEMLYPSVKKILTKLSMKADDVFLDLGSGLGKFAIQVFMQSAAQHVMGIEARPELSELACEAVRIIKNKEPRFWEHNRSLNLIEGNFLEQPWSPATIVYSCSTCFRPELLNAIGEKLNQENSIVKVLSLRPLPTLTRLTLQEVFTVECSWDSALCYLYINN